MRKRSEDELSDAEYWFQYVRHLLGFMDSMSRVLEEAQDPDSALSAEQRSERIASICKGLKYFAAAMREMGIEPETPEETASYSDDHTENSNHR